METFRSYVYEIEGLVSRILKRGDIATNQARITAVLNGEVATKFRSFVLLKNRRKLDTFNSFIIIEFELNNRYNYSGIK